MTVFGAGCSAWVQAYVVGNFLFSNKKIFIRTHMLNFKSYIYIWKCFMSTVKFLKFLQKNPSIQAAASHSKNFGKVQSFQTGIRHPSSTPPKAKKFQQKNLRMREKFFKHRTDKYNVRRKQKKNRIYFSKETT